MIQADASFAEIGRAFREYKKFAVLSHVRPDGDALSSQLALGLSLKQLGKDIRIWNEDGMLEKYSFVPCAELLTKPPAAAEDFDVVIALDTAIQNRLGTSLESIRSTKLWINIDHHPSNPRYGDLVYIDANAPATGQILFELMKSQGLPIDTQIAENLYVAISTDTGSFQYPNTSARTFDIAAELVRTGVDVGCVSQAALASHVHLEGATITHHVDRLEAAGLVRRRLDPDDRRVRLLELTEAGSELYGRQAERWPAFAEYPKKTSRTIPVIVLEPVEDAEPG